MESISGTVVVTARTSWTTLSSATAAATMLSCHATAGAVVPSVAGTIVVTRRAFWKAFTAAATAVAVFCLLDEAISTILDARSPGISRAPLLSFVVAIRIVLASRPGITRAIVAAMIAVLCRSLQATVNTGCTVVSATAGTALLAFVTTARIISTGSLGAFAQGRSPVRWRAVVVEWTVGVSEHTDLGTDAPPTTFLRGAFVAGRARFGTRVTGIIRTRGTAEKDENT